MIELIWIVGRGIPSIKYPMNGVFEFHQVKEIKKRSGEQVLYVCVDLRSLRHWRKWGYHFSIVQGVQVCSINIPCGAISRKWLNKIGTCAFKQLYKKIVNEFGKPDIIHAHFRTMGIFVAETAKKMQIPFILTEHGSDTYSLKRSKSLYNDAKIVYEKADTIIAVSKSAANMIEQQFGIKSRCIYNMLEIENFYHTPKINHTIGSITMVSVGNLISRKNMAITIEAYQFFKERYPNSKLIICGEGPERKNLEELIDLYDLKQNVFLKGYCNKKQIQEIFFQSDFFVLASQAETFGVVYIEALACGLPVIATRCGGPEDFINDTNGLLVAVNDLQALVNAMSNMAEDIDQYDRSAISMTAKEMFAPETIVNEIKKVYQEYRK